MVVNRSCLYFLLYTWVQVSFCLPQTNLETVGSWASYKEVHNDTPQTKKVRDDTVQKDLEEYQTSMLIREYNDGASNLFPTGKSSSNHFFSKDASQIDLADKFKDKSERVKNEIDNVIVTLTKNNDIQRSKRSATPTTSPTVPTHSHYSSKLPELEISKKSENILTECIEDIKSHNFKAADAKLNSIEDESKINFIVHEVYSNEEAHFNLMVEFGDGILKINRKYLVYKALNYEMESNGHRDPYKLIRLIHSLRNQIINNPYAAYGSKEEAESLVSDIINSLKIAVKNNLREGMLNEHYASVLDLAETTYNIENKMCNDIIAELVHELYERIGTKKIISFIPMDPRYVNLAIPAYMSLLLLMQDKGELSSHSVFKIAYHIKGTMRSDSPFFSYLKNILPESVRNAVFASKVCIRNVFRNEYLYSARKWGETYNGKRGYVYTWIPGNKVTEGDWLIEPDGDNFYIKNYMRNEYLYSARPFGRSFDSDRGFVFTWIPGNKVSEGTWKIEPNGNNCYIKNAMRNEYLYSARKWGQTYDEERGYVYTWIPGNIVSSAEWKIEDCS